MIDISNETIPEDNADRIVLSIGEHQPSVLSYEEVSSANITPVNETMETERIENIEGAMPGWDGNESPTDKVPDEDRTRKQEKIHEGFTGRIVRAILGNDQFAINADGVYEVEVTEHRIKPVSLICAPMRIIADIRDAYSQNWGRILEFKDRDGIIQKYQMQMQDLKRDGEAVVDALLSMGLAIMPGKKARLRLVDYMQNSRPENDARARVTDKTGWFDDYFVMPNTVIGNPDEPIIYNGNTSAMRGYCQRGTLEEWQQNIASLCLGNSRLVFAVSSAFAAPLLYQVGEESGGFNFVGSSSTGKSTALHVAASVMGFPKDFIQEWRATSNGLEGIAKQHNDTLLILDELAQVSAKEAGEISYMLANGSGKLRANIKGDPRQRASWRILFLSAGEITLADHMHEGGKRVRAGQEIRLADIPADAGAGLGIFETLNGHENGAAFSNILKHNAAQFHGTVFVKYVEKVTADIQLLRKQVQDIRKDFLAKNLPSGSSSQIHRLAGRFAIIAAAGEIASFFGITGWPVGEAFAAAETCFTALVNARGGVGLQEEEVLLAQFRAYFETHGESRFIPIKSNKFNELVNAADRSTHIRAGFRFINSDNNVMEFLVLPETFREICGGFNYKSAAKILIKHGIIAPAADGRSQINPRLPDLGQKRVYYVTSKIWADD